jgi:hypothetical protein
VGRTPWSARIPLDPLFATESKPTGASAADRGVRPTINAVSGCVSQINFRSRRISSNSAPSGAIS